ncbi:MAG: DUF3782 domain-containing protein [Thermofilum sp.]|nr:DUF3782 domain-containing protein [Thermofilum sp.]
MSSQLKQRLLKLLKEDEEFRYAVAGLLGLEEILKRLDRHEEQLVKLREDMNRGFELIERRISALGARWGIQTEEAFREALKGILEKEFGVKVERWVAKDTEGTVYDYPSDVEIDMAVKDDKTILIEISSHIKASDIPIFRRKAQFYEKATGKKPGRLIIVTPYADEKAIEIAKKFGIEIYTKA